MTFKGLGRLSLTGWGRQAAWAVLVPFLVLQVAAPQLFDTPRFALFDTYQRVIQRGAFHRVQVVAIDQASQVKLGEWPWPRHIQAELISRILKARPAALGVDIVWGEPDSNSPEQWARQARGLDAGLITALTKLPRHDAVLAGTLQDQPVAIGVMGIHGRTRPDAGGFAPFQLHGLTSLDADGMPAIPAGLLPSFDSTIRSIPELDRAASGHGLLATDFQSDAIFRRLPLVSLVNGIPAPALSLEMIRIANGRPIEMLFSRGGVEGIKVGKFAIPTQRDGSIWVHFSTHDESRFLSAADVLAGKVPASAFEGQMVLVGLTGVGLQDQRMTPLGQMPGVEIQAQLLENLADGDVVQRPAWTGWAEPLLTLLLGLLVILALPLLPARWEIPAMVAILFILAATGLGLWSRAFILFDVATPAIGLVLTLAALLVAGFAQVDRQRRSLRLAAAKTAGELEAAHRIQEGILPKPASVAGDARFDLDALMIPARQIGGDFFDFFKIDDDHLYFAVGDVSGKGMPAALFMALGKSLCKSCALREENHIGQIINRANREISRDNTETLFITQFAGILNLETGELRFCNAGHDAPFLLRPGQAPHSLEAKGGPPLCIVEDFDYPEERFQLQPGDMLCVITDGITEAMTAQREVMGRARAQAVLDKLHANTGAAAAARALHHAANEFVAGAEPSDDLTILAVRWQGPSGR
ncbi:MAG: SpoIIE family protein phosphatase [Alphaproteobacteria bacterium]